MRKVCLLYSLVRRHRNLTRPECRNFLVRLHSWVPRNLNYEDGLKILHPKLQEAFGDENMDLACGVLEELIEVEAPTPFPEAVYQRWKYHHLKRRVCILLMTT